MRVAYVNHTSLLGGAERSLAELISIIRNDIDTVLICPRGPLFDRVASTGVPVRAIPPAAPSFRIRSATLAQMASSRRAVRALREALSELNPDVVHANTIRAGLLAGVADAHPLIVHLRDCLPSGFLGNSVRRRIRARAAAVIANSDYTARCFAPPDGRGIQVFYPRISAPSVLSRVHARRLLGLESEPVLAVLAQLTPWKGQDDAIRILAQVRKKLPGAQLALIGEVKFSGPSTRHDNVKYAGSLLNLAKSLGVEHAVHFLGERDDAIDLLPAVDALLAPSWEEPFGRAVAEGLAAGLPILATDRGGPAELIRDGVSGRLLPPRQPAVWADTLVELLGDSATRDQLADGARQRATELAERNDEARLLALYDRFGSRAA